MESLIFPSFKGYLSGEAIMSSCTISHWHSESYLPTHCVSFPNLFLIFFRDVFANDFLKTESVGILMILIETLSYFNAFRVLFYSLKKRKKQRVITFNVSLSIVRLFLFQRENRNNPFLPHKVKPKYKVVISFFFCHLLTSWCPLSLSEIHPD